MGEEEGEMMRNDQMEVPTRTPTDSCYFLLLLDFEEQRCKELEANSTPLAVLHQHLDQLKPQGVDFEVPLFKKKINLDYR